MRSSNLRGHFQFLCGVRAIKKRSIGSFPPRTGEAPGHAANARVWAIVVVCPEPLRGEVLSLLDTFADVLVKPLVPDCAVVTFDPGVLLRLSCLDVLNGNALFISSFQQLDADVFRAIIDPDRAGLAAPFDDAIEAPDYALSRQ
jgi:hypothetical protein